MPLLYKTCKLRFSIKQKLSKTHVEDLRHDINVIASSSVEEGCTRNLMLFAKTSSTRRCKKLFCRHGKGKIRAISSLDRTPHISPRASFFFPSHETPVIHQCRSEGGWPGEGGKEGEPPFEKSHFAFSTPG